jgi:Tripartite tricarboxylate transporter TctB family
MTSSARNKNVASGLLLIAIGAFFAWSGRNLTISDVSNMGPGYFPMVLSSILVLLGLIVLVSSPKAVAGPAVLEEDEPISEPGDVPWRGVILLTVALLFFGLLVRPLGLGPALGGAVALSALASRKWRALPTLIMTAVMVACGWAVFIKLLGMPVPFLGPWLR